MRKPKPLVNDDVKLLIATRYNNKVTLQFNVPLVWLVDIPINMEGNLRYSVAHIHGTSDPEEAIAWFKLNKLHDVYIEYDGYYTRDSSMFNPSFVVNRYHRTLRSGRCLNPDFLEDTRFDITTWRNIYKNGLAKLEKPMKERRRLVRRPEMKTKRTSRKTQTRPKFTGR